jgi:hypothetical protein
MINLLGDNQSSLALIRNLQVHKRSKHIDIYYHNIRDRKRRGQIKISYISTEDMVADGLIKLLSGPIFERSISLLEIKAPKREGTGTTV